MKGEFDARLRRILDEARRARVCTQESLASAMGKTQTSVGLYLRGKGGALDVDEAAAGLHHIGSNLRDFVAGVPPPSPSETVRLANALLVRPELQEALRDLLVVPRRRLPVVLELIANVARATSGKRGGGTTGSRGGSQTPQGTPRTTRGPRKRR